MEIPIWKMRANQCVSPSVDIDTQGRGDHVVKFHADYEFRTRGIRVISNAAVPEPAWLVELLRWTARWFLLPWAVKSDDEWRFSWLTPAGVWLVKLEQAAQRRELAGLAISGIRVADDEILCGPCPAGVFIDTGSRWIAPPCPGGRSIEIHLAGKARGVSVILSGYQKVRV